MDDSYKILIQNGEVFTMDNSKEFLRVDILINNGKINKVEDSITCEEDVLCIDASGYVVLPGLIDSHCHIGICETGIGPIGIDGNESSEPATPQLRAIDGINPFDEEFKVSRENGVTTVATGPGSSNPIGGTFLAMKTMYSTFEKMIIKDPLAMKIAFGENPKTSFGSRNLSPITRMATASIIREWLEKAKYYSYKKEESKKKGTYFPIDFGLEALMKVLNKEIPLKAHAHRADDIFTALRIAKEFSVDITIDHCSEGHFIPQELSFAKGVIIGPLSGFPQKVEVRNQSPEAANILFEHGILFSIMSDLPATHTHGITRAAGECVKHGLPMIEGLKAITCNAAKILGLNNRLGSIKVGMDADIAIFNKNPITSMQSSCVMTIIDGKVVFASKDAFPNINI